MSQKLTQLTRAMAKIPFTVDAFKNLRTPGAVVYANRFREMRHDQEKLQRARAATAAASQLTRQMPK
jgi:hypothetical protein